MEANDRLSARAAARRFGVIAAATVTIIAALVLATAGFDFLGAGFHVNLAMLLGIIGTIGVGVGLMALTFYSSRSGADEKIGGDAPNDPEP